MEPPCPVAPTAFAEGETYRPDSKVLTIWRLSNLFGTLVVLLLVLPFGFFLRETLGPWTLWAPSLVVLALGTLSQAVLVRQWRAWLYRLSPGTLEMEQGWLWRRRRVVRRERIQHVDFNSGPFDRRFGLVQVVVYTAGTTVGMIPGLTPETAEALRAALVARAAEPISGGAPLPEDA